MATLALVSAATRADTIFTESMGTVSATTTITAHEAANGFDNDSYTMTQGGATNPADIRSTNASTGYPGASGSANVWFTNTSGEYGFAIEGIDASNFTGLTIRFGYRKESATALPSLALDYWNGTSYVNVPFNFNEAANAGVAWYLSPTINLPSGAQINGLKLRWVKTGTVAVRIDDVVLSGTPSGSSPTISLVGTLTNFGNTVVGNSSASQNYQVYGTNLTDDITVTAPTNFEVSLDNSNWYSSRTLSLQGDSVPHTTIYARFSPGASAYGAQSGNIAHTSSGASQVNQPAAGNGLDTEPSAQASNLAFSNVTASSMTVSWSRGNGDSVIVLARASSDLTADPADGADYTANAAYGSGTPIGGGYVIYKGDGTSVNLTGLSGSTTYYLRVYEYNSGGAANSANYLMTPASGSQATQAGSQASDYFRSKQSGTWNATSTWESSSDGVNWIDATLTPDYNANTITIRNGHTVTMTANVTIDQTIIAAGGQLTVNSGATLSTNDGAGEEITVAGTILHQGTVPNPMNGTGTVEIGGTYIHNTTSSAARMSTFFSTKNSNSNWIYRGSSSLNTAISMANQTYGNLTFESTSGSWSPQNPTGSSPFNVNGNFVLGSNVNLTLELSSTMSFAGDFTIDGTLTNSANTQNYTFTGSGKTIGGSSAIEFETWNIASGASITLGRNVGIASGFTGTVAGTLDCGAYTVSGDGNFTLSSGGTLGIGSADGIAASGASGNIQVAGTRSFSASANYAYNGSLNQDCGPGLPDTVNNLTVSGTDSLSLYKNCHINGTLHLAGKVFYTGGNAFLGITRPITGTLELFQPDPYALLYIGGTAEGIVLPSAADSLHSLVVDNPNGVSLSGDLWIVGDVLIMRQGAISLGGHAVHYGSGTGLNYSGSSAQTTNAAEFPVSDGPWYLYVSNPEGVSLHDDRSLPMDVTVENGFLSTGSHTLFLGSEATITESDTSYVVGNVQTTRTLSEDVSESFGGLGLELEAATASPGATTVTRVTGTPVVQGNVQSIKRYFNIQPAINSGLGATMVFHYFEDELNGIAEAKLGLFRSPDLSRWAMYGDGGTVNAGNNTVTATGIDSFSYWTLGDKDSPLAVELSSFSALASDGAITLSWRTESENGSYQWIVERSDSERGPFAELGRLPAAGQSQSPRDYNWADRSAQAGVTYYYRIGELTQIGMTTYFGPVSCSMGRGLPLIDLALGCAPNPFRQTTEIRYQVARPSQVSLKMYNVAGQCVRTLLDEQRTPGYHSVSWDGRDDGGRRLSTGVYLYRIAMGGRQFGGKVQLVR